MRHSFSTLFGKKIWLIGRFGRFLKTNSFFANAMREKRIFLLGENGYLGFNLKEKFSQLGVGIIAVDSRVASFERIKLNQKDLVLDCSRLRHLDSKSIEEDKANHQKVLDWVKDHDSNYLRIGSILEEDASSEDSPYKRWSQAKTRSVLSNRFNGYLGVLLVPNIYGGKSSKSIIDLLFARFLSNEKVELSNPHLYRDFLNIDSYVNSMTKFITSIDTECHSFNVLTTGLSFNVASLQDFLHSNCSSKLVYKKLEFRKELYVIHTAGTVERDIQLFCTLYSRFSNEIPPFTSQEPKRSN